MQIVSIGGDLPQGIVYFLEGTFYNGKVRNKVLLHDIDL